MLTLFLLSLAGVALLAHRFFLSAALSILAMTSAVFAQTAAGALDPNDLGALAKLALAAITSGNWWLAASLAVIAAVWAVRHLGAARWPWLATDRGGALLVLLTAIAGGIANALAAGAAITLPTLLVAIQVAIGAAGGYSLVKKIVTGKGDAPAKPADPPAPVRSPLDIVNGTNPEKPSDVEPAHVERDG